MNVAVYVRISRDSTGLSAGVRRQEQDCRALAESHGWTVTEVFTDNDVSAYSTTPRPGYEALLSAVEAKQVEAVVAWHTDRLYRRMADLERYIQVSQQAEVPTYTVQAGPLDLTTASGRMVARQLGAVAQYESEQKAARQRRANEQRALTGKHFGTRRCFGYEMDGVTVRTLEAQAIRYGYEAVLNGVSLRQIARRWNQEGLRGPQGKRKLPADVEAEWLEHCEQAAELGQPRPPRPYVPTEWTGTTVRQTLTNPRLAGMKTYRGEIVRDATTGEPITAEWPSIVNLDTWQAAQALFNDPERRAVYPSSARLLLSGLAVCADCGAPMQSGGTRNGKHRYRCSQNASHVYREAEPIDDYVAQTVRARLGRSDLGKTLATTRPMATRIRQIRKDLDELAARQKELGTAYAAGAVTLSQLTAANEQFRQQRQQLEAQLPNERSPMVQRLLGAPDPVALWDRLDPDSRRAVIDTLCTVEVLAPGTKENAYLDWRSRVINPETVNIRWRTPDHLAVRVEA